MHVSLVGHIENQTILRRPEDAVQGYRQFDDSEIRPDVTSVGRGHGDETLPNLLGEQGQIFAGQGFYVVRAVDIF